MAELKDSGTRRDFGTGAVRDCAEGKGRCDLLPLKVAGALLHDPMLGHLALFKAKFDPTKDSRDQPDARAEVFSALYALTGKFSTESYEVFGPWLAGYKPVFPDVETLILEASKQFEDGARKYGEDNWRAGIPAKCYIDSAIRHYLKYRRGDVDEPHDRACAWNLMCLLWELAAHDQRQYTKAAEAGESPKTLDYTPLASGVA